MSYEPQADEIVIRLGSGRRPRPVAAAFDVTMQAELDTSGRLVRLTLIDNKVLGLGRRLAGLTVLRPAPDLLPGGTISYDLSARVACLTIWSVPDDQIDERVVRRGEADFDGQARLLALHLPVAGPSRRDPTLYRALAYLAESSVPGSDDR